MSWVEKHMTKKVQLHLFLTIGLLACVTALLSSARPLGAAPDAFGLTVNVNPAGKGSVNVRKGSERSECDDASPEVSGPASLPCACSNGPCQGAGSEVNGQRGQGSDGGG